MRKAKEDIILEPFTTEKTTLARAENKYVFKVAPFATKVDIRSAIEKLFKVKVLDVNTVKRKGKARMLGKSRGRTKGFKKAYVTLVPGQKIETLEV